VCVCVCVCVFWFVRTMCVCVLVCKDVCVGGTYSGQEPMGLLWSLRPVPGSRTGLRYACPYRRIE